LRLRLSHSQPNMHFPKHSSIRFSSSAPIEAPEEKPEKA